MMGREPETEDYLSKSLYIYPDVVQEIAGVQHSFLARLCKYFDPYLNWDRIVLMSALHNVRLFFYSCAGAVFCKFL